MINILFVCLGNTCRSVLCEYISYKLIKERNLSDKFIIKSCGISAFNKSPASDNVIKIIEKFDKNIYNHLSSNITKEKIVSSDYVVALDKFVFEYLKQYCDKSFHHKISLFPPNGVADPYGLSFSIYESCAKAIEEGSKNILQEIIKNEEL